jgi:hypothetical protein
MQMGQLDTSFKTKDILQMILKAANVLSWKDIFLFA